MDDQALVEGSVVFKDEADPAGGRAQLVGPIARTQHLRIRKASGKTAPSQHRKEGPGLPRMQLPALYPACLPSSLLRAGSLSPRLLCHRSENELRLPARGQKEDSFSLLPTPVSEPQGLLPGPHKGHWASALPVTTSQAPPSHPYAAPHPDREYTSTRHAYGEM